MIGSLVEGSLTKKKIKVLIPIHKYNQLFRNYMNSIFEICAKIRRE